ncbi:hypothetical protein PZ895_13695 [Mesorhizobium sp. YIM 152430]|uniref:hypothetical protein n=1 Tax=Mesorhizobium sp. YIM 152430 TaxID=3031761 RepID=UPI0023DBD5CB|nr:hypothetical protein [Mesorhizobium sp. YIM 152430]MDF1600817.1 hypothetical protein [Mesorhizobium sp. YIM 152430]
MRFTPQLPRLFALALLATCSAETVQAGETMDELSAVDPPPIWQAPIFSPGPAPDTIALQGTRGAAGFDPQLAYVPKTERPEAGGREPLPFRADILADATPRPFGRGERVEIVAGDRMTIACTKGDFPAGAVFSFAGRFPQEAAFEIVVDGHLETVGLALVRKGGDASRPADLIGSYDPSSNRIFVPAGVATGDAELVLLCPTGGTHVEIASLTLEPRRVARDATHGAWIWDAAGWLDCPDALLEKLRAAGLDEIYLQLPLGDSTTFDPWTDFLRHFRDAGVRIVAVEGDPAMVLDHGRRNAVLRATRLAAFRREHPGLIAGVQYDVEPYLLAAHAADPETSWRAWAELIVELRGIFDAPVSVVVPFWMMGDPTARTALTKAVAHVDDLVVMAYRTDFGAIEDISAPWLEFAASESIGVRIALENGPLPIEHHRIYRRAQAGEVALLAGPISTVELHPGPVHESPGRKVYAFSHEVVTDPLRTTFDGDLAGLAAARTRLTETLSAWPYFRGLAFHGLIALSESTSHGGCDARDR